ncbi:hypothetical protein SHIRM173S_11154 [Streptomyces hirsutus]
MIAAPAIAPTGPAAAAALLAAPEAAAPPPPAPAPAPAPEAPLWPAPPPPVPFAPVEPLGPPLPDAPAAPPSADEDEPDGPVRPLLPLPPAIERAPVARPPPTADMALLSDAPPRAAVAGTTSRSRAGSETAESSMMPMPAMRSWISSESEVISTEPAYITRAAAGLYNSQAISQPRCLRHQPEPQSVMEAAAAMGRVPSSRTMTPSRM